MSYPACATCSDGALLYSNRHLTELSMPETKDAAFRQRLATAKFISVMAGAALIAYLAMNHLMFRDVMHYFSDRGTVVSLVYLAWMFCGFAVFLALVALANRWVLWLLAP